MKEELREAFSKAVKLREGGDLESAKGILLALSQSDPGSALIFATLGHTYWDMNSREEAVEAFERATGLDPNFEAASLGLFHCLWQLGRRNEAFEELKRYQTLSDSQEYREIVAAINEGSD